MHHRRVHSACKIISLMAALAVALPLTALVERHDSALQGKAFRLPDLHIGSHYIPAVELTSVDSAQALVSLGVAPNSAYMDPRGGRWGTLMPRHPILPGDGVGNTLRWDDLDMEAPATRAELRQRAWEAFVRFVSERQDALNISAAELQQPGNVTISRDGDLIQIHAPRMVDGVRVRGAFVNASISHGNLILFGARNWGDVDLGLDPQVTVEAAIASAREHLGDAGADAAWRKSDLVIVPMAKGVNAAEVAIGDGYNHRLVWVLNPGLATDAHGQWEALIDAHSGELVAFQDTANYASTREVEGGVYPISNDGVAPDGIEVQYPMPFADLANGGSNFVTDTGGNLLSCVDGDITTALAGPFIQINDACGTVNETTSGDILDLGMSGGTDCVVPPGASAGNTHSARSGFYELNRSAEWGRSHLPDNIWLQMQLPSAMNNNGNCNALGGPGGLTFFTSGGGCSNTGEIAGVFVHEWGHGMDGSDATPTISSPGEGIADIYASLRLNTSCIGRNFRPGANCGGYGDPCTQCSGVRDIDFANRASGQPHDIAFIDQCGPGNTNGPCGGSVHCEGAVYGEAVWDLWNRDLVAAPYNMSLDTARELATRLTFVGSGAVGNWFNCNPGQGTGDGCNADGGYLSYLAADDDDGNLNNGTPHMQAISAAFGRHGIACPTPTVTDSGCAGTPTTAPSVTATARDRGVGLTWNAIAGADSYRVYRAEGVHGCDFGKILVAEITGTSYVDEGLKNGREYSYIVTPMGDGDTCFGPASSCAMATPTAGANLGLDFAASGTLSFVSGDGDAFLDNCEQATVAVSLFNLGNGSQTDVQIVDVRAPDYPEIQFTSALPQVLASNLSACDTAQGTFGLYADGLALGDVVTLELDVTSTEMLPTIKTLNLQLAVPGTESDLQNFASRTFSFEADAENWSVVAGTFDRTSTGGGASGSTFYTASSGFLANQCDQIRSPVMTLTPSSTMTMWTNFNIEGDGGTGTWYDRANVGIYEFDSGSRTLVEPSAGRDYNAMGANGTCGTANQRGWADSAQSWATSTFDAAALDAANLAGEFIQFDIRYGTDPGLHLDGFWFDELTVTDVNVQVEDNQSNVCAGPTVVFQDGFETGDVSRWAFSIP
ncbi:MAG: hypothetical protein AAF657_22820 [Acidobacteriota bacterium]